MKGYRGCVWRVLALSVVMIPQGIQTSNHYAVCLKLRQSCSQYCAKKKKCKAMTTPTPDKKDRKGT